MSARDIDGLWGTLAIQTLYLLGTFTIGTIAPEEEMSIPLSTHNSLMRPILVLGFSVS